MSGKSARTPAAKKQSPRALADIQQEYQQLCLKSGQFQYQKYVLERDLEVANKRLFEINSEAAERNQLDAEAQKAEVKEGV